MKKNESKATKPGLKSTPAETKKTIEPKKSRGGARPGAGRKKTKGDTQQIHLDMLLPIIEAMEKCNIQNKTAFFTHIAAKELKTYQAIRKTAKLRSQLDKIYNDQNVKF